MSNELNIMENEKEIISENNEMEENFEELLNQTELKTAFFQPGQEVEADIIQVADEWVFIDIGSKSEGVIALSEFSDEEGNISIKEGDPVKAFFLSSRNNEKLFTTRLTLESTGKEFLRV